MLARTGLLIAVGMLLDVDVIIAQPLFVAGLALALVAVKIAIIFALGRFFGLKSKPSIISTAGRPVIC